MDSFFEVLIDYGDIIYDQSQYESSCEKPENIYSIKLNLL